MTTAYEIRNSSPEDRREILSLIERVWSKGVSAQVAERWQWQLDTFRKGKNDNSFLRFPAKVAEFEGEMVGFCWGFLQKVQIGQETADSLYITDFVVHPEHRGRALGEQLVSAMFSEKLIFLGFPRGTTYRVWQKDPDLEVVDFYYGKRYLHMEKTLRRFVRSHMLSRALGCLLDSVLQLWWNRQTRSASEIRITEVSRFGQEYDEFWKEVSKDYGVLTVRDSHFLNWRFMQCMKKRYHIAEVRRCDRLSGYIVLRSNHLNTKLGAGQIIDYLTSREDTLSLSALLGYAVQYYRNQGLRTITVLLPKVESHCETFRKFGFIANRKDPIKLAFQTKYDRTLKGNLFCVNSFFTLADSDLEFYP